MELSKRLVAGWGWTTADGHTKDSDRVLELGAISEKEKAALFKYFQKILSSSADRWTNELYQQNVLETIKRFPIEKNIPEEDLTEEDLCDLVRQMPRLAP